MSLREYFFSYLEYLLWSVDISFVKDTEEAEKLLLKCSVDKQTRLLGDFSAKKIISWS